MAAENDPVNVDPASSDSGFNEAAANGRGKPTAPRRARADWPRFNEAAANGRGKQWDPGAIWRIDTGFNEAAANGRGKLGRPRGSPPSSTSLQ